MLFEIDLHRHDIANLQFAKVAKRMTVLTVKHDRFERRFYNILGMLWIVFSAFPIGVGLADPIDLPAVI